MLPLFCNHRPDYEQGMRIADPAPSSAIPPLAPARFAVILLAGGVGARAGLAVPKQAALLGGRPVLWWSLGALTAMPGLARLVVVGDDTVAGMVAEWRGAAALPPGVAIASAAPGASRQASVASGLAALADWPDVAPVLVHDSARPGVDGAVVARLLSALADGAAAAIPVVPLSDTLVRHAGGVAADTVARDGLGAVQTPQAFVCAALRRAHAAWGTAMATDDAQMVRALGEAVAVVAGDARLHKLTYASDLAILAALLVPAPPRRRMAVGSGYDVHRLVAGKPLWLGGLNIPHSHGLSGHSDADVALHAITDAILGALGDGDIGQHFPPTDPQWRGAASGQFLAFAAQRVRQAGGEISHIDLTIIAEAPKIGPHRAAMRARIAELIAIAPSRISIKATTTEGLGFAGRREGIAAQAMATLELMD